MAGTRWSFPKVPATPAACLGGAWRQLFLEYLLAAGSFQVAQLGFEAF